jgi:hypothetical protein
LRGREPERVHGIDRRVAAHVEGMVGSQHDVVGADALDQESQRLAAVGQAVAKDVVEIRRRRFRQARTYLVADLVAVVEAAELIGQETAAMRKRDPQPRVFFECAGYQEARGGRGCLHHEADQVPEMEVAQAGHVAGILWMQEQGEVVPLRGREHGIKICKVKIDAVNVRADRRAVQMQLAAGALKLARRGDAILQRQGCERKKPVRIGLSHLGKPVVHGARDALADCGWRPVREQLWRRADGRGIEPAPVHLGKDKERVEEPGVDGRTLLYRYSRGRSENELARRPRAVDINHAVEGAAAHQINERGRKHMKVDIDGRHRLHAPALVAKAVDLCGRTVKLSFELPPEMQAIGAGRRPPVRTEKS